MTLARLDHDRQEVHPGLPHLTQEDAIEWRRDRAAEVGNTNGLAPEDPADAAAPLEELEEPDVPEEAEGAEEPEGSKELAAFAELYERLASLDWSGEDAPGALLLDRPKEPEETGVRAAQAGAALLRLALVGRATAPRQSAGPGRPRASSA